MKITIDASILVGSATAYGRLLGSLSLAAVPAPDTLISFQFPTAENVARPSEFVGQLRVRTVIFRPGDGDDAEILAMLEDLVVQSTEQAESVTRYLTRGFGLQVEEYL